MIDGTPESQLAKWTEVGQASLHVGDKLLGVDRLDSLDELRVNRLALVLIERGSFLLEVELAFRPKVLLLLLPDVFQLSDLGRRERLSTLYKRAVIVVLLAMFKCLDKIAHARREP